MAFLFFGYTQAFEGNKMGGRVFNDLFLIFLVKATTELCNSCMYGYVQGNIGDCNCSDGGKRSFWHVSYLEPERKHSLVIYLAYLLLACSWAKEEGGMESILDNSIYNKSTTSEIFNSQLLQLFFLGTMTRMFMFDRAKDSFPLLQGC